MQRVGEKKTYRKKPTVLRFHWSNHQIFEASTGLIVYNPSRRQLVVIHFNPSTSKTKTKVNLDHLSPKEGVKINALY